MTISTAVKRSSWFCLALCSLFVFIANANAGTYTVHSCINGIADGWTSSATGAYSSAQKGCVQGSPYGLYGATSDAANAMVSWTFTAPSATKITGFQVHRSYELKGGQTYGTPVYALQTGPDLEYYNYQPNWTPNLIQSGWDWERASGLDEDRLHIIVTCGGGMPCKF